MVFFLVLIIAAIGLGVAGAVAAGVFYLVYVGAAVFVADLVYLGAWLGRRSRRPAR